MQARMSEQVVNDPKWGPQLTTALTQIPSVSFVTDLDHLVGEDGIYVNSGRKGSDYERPVSVELIHPDGSQ